MLVTSIFSFSHNVFNSPLLIVTSGYDCLVKGKACLVKGKACALGYLGHTLPVTGICKMNAVMDRK